MSYLALARKWRPKTFAELVGQEHVVTALRQALDSGRVHHAFLFTGTRGVGKTTIARIFAKSLNCAEGVSSEPCGQCAICRDVDAGRFVDLIEIDAASNTGVDDVRDLIDSAQYGPARGRFKVFLIDEVHMLSRNAFNALLKTLEEPPGHVKFLLATTDPQKLLVTVLSRCLQFNLRRLDREEIAGQMAHILAAEEIAAEPAALDLIAVAADGSLRDGLSLLDQAIVHGGGRLTREQVQAMLGTLDQDAVLGLLEALVNGDAAAIRAAIEVVAAYVVDYAEVLRALATALHRIQLRQLLPGADDDGMLDPLRMQALAQAMSPEDVQLYYQLATVAARDVGLAPTPRIGFEMGVLRLLAFRPGPADNAPVGAPGSAPPTTRRSPGGQPAAGSGTPGRDPAAAAAVRQPDPPVPAAGNTPVGKAAVPPPAAAAVPDDGGQAGAGLPVPRDAAAWAQLLPQLDLTGLDRQLAENCTVLSSEDGQLRLGVGTGHQLLIEVAGKRVEERILAALGQPLRIRFEVVGEVADTPAARNTRQQQARQAEAEAGFAADPQVQAAMDTLDADILPGSVRPRRAADGG